MGDGVGDTAAVALSGLPIELPATRFPADRVGLALGLTPESAVEPDMDQATARAATSRSAADAARIRGREARDGIDPIVRPDRPAPARLTFEPQAP